MKQIKCLLSSGGNKSIILLFTMLFITIPNASPQYKLRYNNNNLADINYGLSINDDFRATLSLVAMFTIGAADRNGLRLGVGLTLSQTIGDWNILTGVDAYKAKQHFGLGTSFAGTIYNDGRYGGSYIVNKYHQGDKQTSAIVSLHLNDFQINFEDDILAMPFSGFKIYDRYRTAALEVRYKNVMIGTNVYTTDINGITDASSKNKMGIYTSGRQVSSPLYVGYVRNGLIMRLGINNPSGGWIGQNAWHQYLFGTPDFHYGNYNAPFFQLGVDKPYTLY